MRQTSIFGIVLVGFLFGQVTHAQIAGMVPIEVNDVPTHVYVPSGFDANDITEVWIEGILQNNCVKQGPVKVDKSDLKKGRIIIYNTNYHYRGFLCIPDAHRYKKRVEIGVLGKPNEYDLVFKDPEGADNKDAKWKLPIAEVDPKYTQKDHRFGPDNDYYAPVDGFEMIYNPKIKKYQIILTGEFSHSNMEIERVIPISSRNVVEVLPFMKHPKKGEIRMPVLSRFRSKPWDLGNVPKGRSLIHVRALSGHSASDIVDFSEDKKGFYTLRRIRLQQQGILPMDSKK